MIKSLLTEIEYVEGTILLSEILQCTFSAGEALAAHRGQSLLDLDDKVLVEENLVQDVPQADTFLTNDCDEAIAALIRARVDLDLLL